MTSGSRPLTWQQEVFVRCSACHVVGEKSGGRDGPNLWGAVDRPIASRSPGFAYTAALKSVGGIWSIERLDRWLTDPRAFAPGTAMAFPGLSDPVDRADVIAFLVYNGPKGGTEVAGHNPPAPHGGNGKGRLGIATTSLPR